MLRRLLLTVLFGLSFFTACAAAEAQFVPKRVDTVDVVVAGGGSAGVPAAVQAARMGAKTVLVEAGFQIGGNATSGGVNFPGLFHAWGKQVISGIGWEWVEKTVRESSGTMPDFSVPTGRWHWKHQIRVNIPTYVLIGEELCANAGVELRYYESPIAAEAITPDSPDRDASAKARENYRWKITTAAQGEVRVLYCKQLVDCTGNGALAALCGAARMRESETQPGTFNYKIKHHIDLNKLDKEAAQKAFDEALRDGRLEPGDARGGIAAFLQNSENNYVYGADNSTAEARTETNLRGRRAALRMLRFVRSLPGGEDAVLESMSPDVGVRETYRVEGEYVITHDDYVSGRVWDDSLAYAFYPVDLHENASGVHPKHLQEGTVATVPLRALLAKGVPNLLVAGRCVSSDRLANSALRVQATCMACGQAAGAAAALAALQDAAPGELNVEDIKNALREQGAIVP